MTVSLSYPRFGQLLIKDNMQRRLEKTDLSESERRNIYTAIRNINVPVVTRQQETSSMVQLLDAYGFDVFVRVPRPDETAAPGIGELEYGLLGKPGTPAADEAYMASRRFIAAHLVLPDTLAADLAIMAEELTHGAIEELLQEQMVANGDNWETSEPDFDKDELDGEDDMPDDEDESARNYAQTMNLQTNDPLLMSFLKLDEIQDDLNSLAARARYMANTRREVDSTDEEERPKKA